MTYIVIIIICDFLELNAWYAIKYDSHHPSGSSHLSLYIICLGADSMKIIFYLICEAFLILAILMRDKMTSTSDLDKWLVWSIMIMCMDVLTRYHPYLILVIAGETAVSGHTDRGASRILFETHGFMSIHMYHVNRSLLL